MITAESVVTLVSKLVINYGYYFCILSYVFVIASPDDGLIGQDVYEFLCFTGMFWNKFFFLDCFIVKMELQRFSETPVVI